MPRVKLELRPDYPFSFGISVRTTDLNYGGHLGNDRLLSLVHEARVAFLADHQWSEMDCAGVSLILSDTAVVYRAEAFAGEILSIEVAAGEASRSGFRLFFRITRPSDDRLIALVENGMACFDYEAGKVVALPREISAVCSI